MIMIIAVSISQLVLGPIAASALNTLPSVQSDWINWFGIVIGLAGLAGAIIPERLVRIARWEWDATWWRLTIELASHGGMVFLGLTYFATFTIGRLGAETLADTLALSLASGAALWLAGAASWRCGQILWTIHRALVQPPGATAIVSAETAGLENGG